MSRRPRSRQPRLLASVDAPLGAVTPSASQGRIRHATGRRRSAAIVAASALGMAVLAACSASTPSSGRTAGGTAVGQDSTAAAGGSGLGELGSRPGWDCPGGRCDWGTPTRPSTFESSSTTATIASGQATSGSTSQDSGDLADFEAYRVDALANVPGAVSVLPAAPVVVTVTGGNGAPFGGAIVELLDDGGAVVATTRSRPDGRAPVVVDDGVLARVVSARATAPVFAARPAMVPFPAGSRTASVQIGEASPTRPVDVMFVVDATGSMTPDLQGVHGVLAEIVGSASSFGPDARFGVSAFRDVGETFVTHTFNLTDDETAIRDALDDLQTGGGGDTPDAIGAGLADAIGKPGWRPHATRVVVLFTDSPPRVEGGAMDPLIQPVLDIANREGVTIVTVAVPGADPRVELALRELAAGTGGRSLVFSGPWPNPGSGGSDSLVTAVTQVVRQITQPGP